MEKQIIVSEEFTEALEDKFLRHGYNVVGKSILADVLKWLSNHERFKGFQINFVSDEGYAVTIELEGWKPYESNM